MRIVPGPVLTSPCAACVPVQPLPGDVRTSGVQCRLFVRDADSGELAASLDFDNTEWEEKTLAFTVPKDANYHVGIESAHAAEGKAEIDEMRLLGNCDAAFGYKFVGMDPCRDRKPLYFFDETLWKDE